MDKVLLGSKDIESLFGWRDNHKDEVRSNPIPVRSIEIICKDTQVKVKCVREHDILKVWVNVAGKSEGHVEFSLNKYGMWREEKNRSKLNSDGIQSCLSLYCSVVAIMVYGEKGHTRFTEGRKSDERNRSQKKQSGNYTYLLRGRGDSIHLGRNGEHASPKGTFNVRGHYRHYKSGKVVWINEYRKGEGKRNGKKYRLSKKDAEHLQQ